MGIYVHRNNQTYGPYTIEQVNSFIESKQLRGNDYAWYEGASDWVLLCFVPGVVVKSSEATKNVCIGCLMAFLILLVTSSLGQIKSIGGLLLSLIAFLLTLSILIVQVFKNRLPSTTELPPIVFKIKKPWLIFTCMMLAFSINLNGNSIKGRRELGKADKLWENAQKDMAILHYEQIYDKYETALSYSQKSQLIERLIEVYGSQGNESKAAYFCQIAISNNMDLNITNNQAAQIYKETEKKANEKASSGNTIQPSGISTDTYSAIQIGMSKQRVFQMLGRPNSTTSSETDGYGTMEMCQWNDFSLFGGKMQAITVFFENDVVSDKNWTEL